MISIRLPGRIHARLRAGKGAFRAAPLTSGKRWRGITACPGKTCPGLDPGWAPVFRSGHAQMTKLGRIGMRPSRLLKNAHFVFARDGRNWLDFEEAFVEQA
jgi:hypothetical protein